MFNHPNVSGVNKRYDVVVTRAANYDGRPGMGDLLDELECVRLNHLAGEFSPKSTYAFLRDLAVTHSSGKRLDACMSVDADGRDIINLYAALQAVRVIETAVPYDVAVRAQNTAKMVGVTTELVPHGTIMGEDGNSVAVYAVILAAVLAIVLSVVPSAFVVPACGILAVFAVAGVLASKH